MKAHTPLFLGLDSSTQSLSAVVIDLDHGRVVYEKSLNFDQSLPQFGTQNGVLPNKNPLVRHGNPLLWVAAMDLIFAAMKQDGVPLDRIASISGSGQQHGSVYLNEKAAKILAQLDPRRDLQSQLRGIFSRCTAPIWMDSSTTRECGEIREKLGGLQKMIEATGSDAFERFTGPQIRKFYRTSPSSYAGTRHIALVSSFMASVLSGRLAPIDYGDGAGMNLMDIRRRQWHAQALRATAPGLARLLPDLAPAGTVIGRISPYFAGKYGVNPEAFSCVWTGDNPASVVGLGLIQPGQAAISLGTSDTLFGTLEKCRTDANGGGHLFGSPAGGYMSLICFKNGSLAREHVRKQFGLKDWATFARQVDRAPIGNHGAILLPWFEPEIVPRVLKAGPRRIDLDENDPPANCRAIFEGQALAMRLHSGWMKITPKTLLATGGGANDRTLLQIMANVFKCKVQRIEVSKSAALGAALQAAYGFLKARGKSPSWPKLVRPFSKPMSNTCFLPNPKAMVIYDQMIQKYAACELAALA